MIYKRVFFQKKIYKKNSIYKYGYKLIHPNKLEDLLHSITEKTTTLIIQTQTKPQETIEVKIQQPSKTFSFNNPT